MFQDSSHNARNRNDGPRKRVPEQQSLDLNNAYRQFLNTARDGIDRAASDPQVIGKEGLGRKVIDTLRGDLKKYLPTELLETHQLRILQSHSQSVILDKKAEGKADVVRFSYMAAVELSQREEPQSYVFMASSDDPFFFNSPVLHFMHFLDRESKGRTGQLSNMNWSVQAALSPQAFHEEVAAFKDLQSSATIFLGDFLRAELCNLLEYDDPSDSRIDERCQVTKRPNGTLEMHFDKQRVPGFSVYLHPQLLKLQCHFPPSLIAHVERTCEI